MLMFRCADVLAYRRADVRTRRRFYSAALPSFGVAWASAAAG